MVLLVEGGLNLGNNRVRMLAYLQLLPIGGTYSPGVVMIIAREDNILPMVRSVSEAYKGDFFIFDAQGQPLVAFNEALVQSTEDLPLLASPYRKNMLSNRKIINCLNSQFQ